MNANQIFGEGFIIRALVNFHEMSGGSCSTGEIAKWLNVSKPTAKKWLDNLSKNGDVCEIKRMSHGKKASFWVITDKAWDTYMLFTEYKATIDKRYYTWVREINPITKLNVKGGCYD